MGEFHIDYELYDDVHPYSAERVLFAGSIRLRCNDRILTKPKNCEDDDGYRGFDLVLDMFRFLWSIKSLLNNETAFCPISGDVIEGIIECEAYRLIRRNDQIIVSVIGFSWQNGDYCYYPLSENGACDCEIREFTIPEDEYYAGIQRSAQIFYDGVLMANGMEKSDYGTNFYRTLKEAEQLVSHKTKSSSLHR